MSKILKNTTGSPISIADTGISLGASPATYTIPEQDYLLWAASSDIVTEIGNSTVVVNDGSVDLSISDGVSLIKGYFPSKISVDGSEIGIQKGTALDSFGKIRTSIERTLFSYSNVYDIDFNLYWSTLTSTGGTVTHNANHGARVLSVTTTTGSKAIIQTRRNMIYYHGLSHVFKFTVNPKGIQPGVRKRFGLFDDSNGIFIEGEAGLAYLVIRSKISGSVVDTKIESNDWNVDILDGNGPSGLYLTDFAKEMLFQIDFAWLGAGIVRLSLMYKGELFVLHEQTYAFEIDTMFNQTAFLPFRAEIETVGTPATSDYMEINCASYGLEGTLPEIYKIRHLDVGTTETTLNTSSSDRPLLAIRINPAYLNSSVHLQNIDLIINSGNSTVYWEIIHNPTITGTPTWANITNSCCQYITNVSSITISGGFELTSGYANVGQSIASNQTKTDVYLGRSVTNTPDIIVLVAKTISSTSKCLSSFIWEETR